MRLLSLVGAGCVVFSAQAAAQDSRPVSLLDVSAPVVNDTTARIRFNIPAQSLTDALSQFSRQAGVRVEADLAAAASLRSQPVSGTYTAAEALRRLLDGSGLAARFVGDQTVRVARAGTGESTYALTPVTVVAASSRGYASARTTTATRTDTPLRDAPQAVTVVTAGLIADQGMQGMADVVRYVPGVTMGAGEGHRDAPTIRGNSSTADFFVDGVRDDAQYLRDVYNVERVEALKGSNAMIFGRGGGGGVINRVSKEAQWAPTRVVTTEGGSFDHKRATVDLGQGLGASVAFRFNGMYENSGGFRDRFDLERFGLNPSVALAVGARTTVRAGYEFFSDDRTVDRGIPSFQGRPSPAGITTFFGNPDVSYSTNTVHSATALLEHSTAGGLTIRNRARWTTYDKFYQNSFPGAVNAAGTQVNLSAYNNATDRTNLFNQTDVTLGVATGALRHTLLVGAEVGRQETDNFRETGYYNDAATSFAVPFDAPTVETPITFRQSATDADNHAQASVAAVYLQDQVELGRYVQLLGGVRYDRFNVDVHNNRTDEDFDRQDDLLSPRAGLVIKPIEPMSIYGSYSVSYLPSSGDQFSSLTVTTETLEPEQFTNYEVGAKWDVLPSLSLTSAVYRLDRTNTTAPDPNDATRVVQTGSQRTTGWELGLTGNVMPWWQVAGGFASQRARVTSRTAAAAEGQKVPLVPEQTFSLWNRWQVLPALGIGLGVIHQDDMFAAIDNTVTLPGFTRADGALFVRITDGLSAQVNVENLLDETYYATSHGNNNIMPGASRTLRLSLTTRR
ncbi:TonB-dependent siderophore receptor [Longimicrobium sp.]|uniref:TonB-dependent siderophore receptor n=1 Tax=Longimicrobium sp. TaxID=2029185 RepID=UPI002E36BD93|nr:TonB-dependent siderophore receptor [Longimicrobium sp.]HEX6040537.1 TonB-dependent siderophore receptor [Longimicrobium sp.]